VVSSIREALANPDFIARQLFDSKLVSGAGSITALPLPIAAAFRSAGSVAGYPALGEANTEFFPSPSIRLPGEEGGTRS
jgi:hypothetical protein